MAKIARKTKRYPSDLTDEEWERIAPLVLSRSVWNVWPGPCRGVCGNVWPAPPASDFSDGLVSLRQRIRPQSKLSTKMEIRALWFS